MKKDLPLPMFKQLILVSSLLSSCLFAAEVLKISKNKMNIAISHDLGSQWKVGQKVCVQSQTGKSYCGEVTKVKPAGAICNMQTAVADVAAGDQVNLEVSSESVEGDGGLGDGKSDLDSQTKELDVKTVEPNQDRDSRDESSKKSKKRKSAFGFQGGLVLGKVSSDAVTDSSFRKAINFGVFLDFPTASGRVSFVPGLAFVQKGYETETFAFGYNYIELPLLLKLRFTDGKFTPIFFAGPYLSFLLSAKYTSTTSDQDVKSQLKTFDFGAICGLGFEAKVAPKMELGLGVSYGMGLSDINKLSEISSAKNKVIQVLLSLGFQ